MSQRSKTYRGQRVYKTDLHTICGCFYCTGYSKGEMYKVKRKQDLKQLTYFTPTKCTSETYFNEVDNETYCLDCGKCI